jgi:hypothetical protein
MSRRSNGFVVSVFVALNLAVIAEPVAATEKPIPVPAAEQKATAAKPKIMPIDRKPPTIEALMRQVQGEWTWSPASTSPEIWIVTFPSKSRILITRKKDALVKLNRLWPSGPFGGDFKCEPYDSQFKFTYGNYDYTVRSGYGTLHITQDDSKAYSASGAKTPFPPTIELTRVARRF